MAEYLVTWRIDMDGDNPMEAADKALIVMQDRESSALTFELTNKETGEKFSVDLWQSEVWQHWPDDAQEPPKWWRARDDGREDFHSDG